MLDNYFLLKISLIFSFKSEVTGTVYVPLGIVLFFTSASISKIILEDKDSALIEQESLNSLLPKQPRLDCVYFQRSKRVFLKYNMLLKLSNHLKEMDLP